MNIFVVIVAWSDFEKNIYCSSIFDYLFKASWRGSPFGYSVEWSSGSQTWLTGLNNNTNKSNMCNTWGVYYNFF